MKFNIFGSKTIKIIEARVSFNLKKILAPARGLVPPVSCSAYLLMDRRWPPAARAHTLLTFLLYRGRGNTSGYICLLKTPCLGSLTETNALRSNISGAKKQPGKAALPPFHLP